jgi:hypothetical protein
MPKAGLEQIIERTGEHHRDQQCDQPRYCDALYHAAAQPGTGTDYRAANPRRDDFNT